MKREIWCMRCDHPLGDTYPNEGYQKMQGTLKKDVLCDWCIGKLQAGQPAVAVSFFKIGGYFAWEDEYLDIAYDRY